MITDIIKTITSLVWPMGTAILLFLIGAYPSTHPLAVCGVITLLSLPYLYLVNNVNKGLRDYGTTAGMQMYAQMVKDPELRFRYDMLISALIFSAFAAIFAQYEFLFFGMISSVYFAVRHYWRIVNTYLIGYESAEELISPTEEDDE